jgi:hypothetical protein
VPRFISERRHTHVPLEAYFKSAKYDDPYDNRRDADGLESVEQATVQATTEKEDVDQEGESDGSRNSPVALRQVRKQEKAILEQDSSATGKYYHFSPSSAGVLV